MTSRPWRAVAGVTLAAVFLASYFAFAAAIGFGGPPASWAAYGEAPVGPPVEQPICFWTDLAFVAAGVAALRRLDRTEAPGSRAVAFGFLLVWMGPASMFEHGTLRTTWGWFDATSIHWFSTFVAGWLLVRAVPRCRALLGPCLVAVWVAIGAWTWRVEASREPVSLACLSLVAVSLPAAATAGVRLAPRTWTWIAGAAVAFAAGMVFLVAGARGGAAAPGGPGARHVCFAAAP